MVTLLGATCVTNTEQKGPAGPWVGEVINAGPDAVSNVTVEANVFDATGRLYAPQYGNVVSARTCPFTLRPKERGWFEIFFQKGPQEPDPVLPLRAEFPKSAQAFDAPLLLDLHLNVRLIETNASERWARVEVRNDSARVYSEIDVCGVLHGPAGNVVEIGRATGPPLPALLEPGETLTLAMYFNTMPPGVIDFFAIAYDRTPPSPCCMP
ncbi:MAG: hypothetical protein WEC75_02295 [Dehalococcoidia bacterium]